jgi:hypothetical protein
LVRQGGMEQTGKESGAKKIHKGDSATKRKAETGKTIYCTAKRRELATRQRKERQDEQCVSRHGKLDRYRRRDRCVRNSRGSRVAANRRGSGNMGRGRRHTRRHVRRHMRRGRRGRHRGHTRLDMRLDMRRSRRSRRSRRRGRSSGRSIRRRGRVRRIPLEHGRVRQRDRGEGGQQLGVAAAKVAPTRARVHVQRERTEGVGKRPRTRVHADEGRVDGRRRARHPGALAVAAGTGTGTGAGTGT